MRGIPITDYVIHIIYYSVVTLEVHITPRTADDADQQFVYVDVTMELNKEVLVLPYIAFVSKIWRIALSPLKFFP